jgi:DNA excision repair protein ERCC-2
MSYTVAVRALCDFTAKCGDLDLRFTPSPSAQDGIAGHAAVRARRKPGYRAEVSLSGDFRDLHVRGRADGYDPGLNQLEEIKTYRGALDAMPANHRQLHWAQAKVYGHLLCRQLPLPEIRVALVYYDIERQTETVLSELYSAVQLETFFDAQCGRFLAWAEQEALHVAARDRACRTLQFPHPAFRPGQRELAAAVYKSAGAACCLMAQAPTGIGKTIGTLFPLLKAGPEQQLDKIFCLTAKTSGRQLALDAAARIKASAPEMPLRVLELVARDKACEYPDKACHGESCPLAKGFYDRLPQARSAMLASDLFDRATVRKVALKHEVCPYYLSQEMVRWADVVVGDYNYYFDLNATLHGLTLNNQWRVGVLVDEAHNLIERARKMYSAELDQASLKALRADAPLELKGPLERLNRSWNALHKDQSLAYHVQAALPDAFLRAVQRATDAIAQYLAENPASGNPRLQQFYFDALHFSRMAETFGDHSLFDMTKTAHAGGRSTRGSAMLCIRNIVPAPFLTPRFAASHSTTLFSATLSPAQFYSDMLGLPDTARWSEVQSPFRAEQLSVKLAARISTRYRDRDGSLAPIVELIARQFAERPGNYLAFFSSFDYLQKVFALFCERHPHIPTWTQARRMEEPQRDEFLARFTETGSGVGFAVLGGAFAEGIDLPGDRLIGAFIATLGLPQTNPLNEQIKMRMQARFGAGYEYAYLFPGLQKVVQAAGRVIRSATDRGTVFLIDDRFSRPEVRRLLPDWWDIDVQYADP